MSKLDKEIKQKRDWFLHIFGVDDERKLPEKVLEACLSGDTKTFDEYLKEYPDLERDTLREFFEIFFADKNFLAQQFTPDGVALLMAELTASENQKEVLDECAGIGSLVIPVWRKNHDVIVYARELSATTTPFLLFNLAIRNIRGIVVCGDTLTLETYDVYFLEKGKKYSKITKLDCFKELQRVDPFKILKMLYGSSESRRKL